MSVQGSISLDNCRLHFLILYIDLYPSCASEEHPGETLRNAVSTHLSRPSSISPHVERRLNVCVVAARQGRVDWYILALPPVLKYWNIDRQRTRRSLDKSEEGVSSVSFSLWFCGRPSSGYFRRLAPRSFAHVRADFKMTREDRITLGRK